MQMIIIAVVISVIWAKVINEPFEKAIMRLIFAISIPAIHYVYMKYLTSLFDDIKAMFNKIPKDILKPETVSDYTNFYIMGGIILFIIMVKIFKRKPSGTAK